MLAIKSNSNVIKVTSTEIKNYSSKFSNAISVCASLLHIIVLKSNGTVVAEGTNWFGECNLSSWRNIIDLEESQETSIGLKSDGTIVSAGWDTQQYNWFGWEDIVSIDGINGLKADGSIVCLLTDDISKEYLDVVAISGRYGRNIDGTVVNAFSNQSSLNIGDWTDIVAIDGSDHLVGLKSDGTVVAVGDNTYGQCNVESWTDIVEICAYGNNTIGLKSDGSLMIAGETKFKEVSGIMIPKQIVTIDLIY